MGGMDVLWGLQILVISESYQWLWVLIKERSEGVGIMQNEDVNYQQLKWKIQGGVVVREEVEFSCEHVRCKAAIGCSSGNVG